MGLKTWGLLPLKSAKIGGSVGYSAWQVAGSAGAVTINGAAVHWRFYASDSIKSVKMALGVNSAVSAGAKLGGFTTMNWTNGRLGGGTIGLIMLQLARLSGAAVLILAEPIAEKREKAM